MVHGFCPVSTIGEHIFLQTFNKGRTVSRLCLSQNHCIKGQWLVEKKSRINIGKMREHTNIYWMIYYFPWRLWEIKKHERGQPRFSRVEQCSMVFFNWFIVSTLEYTHTIHTYAQHIILCKDFKYIMYMYLCICASRHLVYSSWPGFPSLLTFSSSFSFARLGVRSIYEQYEYMLEVQCITNLVLSSVRQNFMKLFDTLVVLRDESHRCHLLSIDYMINDGHHWDVFCFAIRESLQATRNKWHNWIEIRLFSLNWIMLPNDWCGSKTIWNSIVTLNCVIHVSKMKFIVLGSYSNILHSNPTRLLIL